MYRAILLLAASLVAASAIAATPPSGPTRPHAGGPPHAWLFGSWTGGLFPAPGHLTAQACHAQPTVIFTRDVVMRATLTDVTYVERVIETARTWQGGTDFVFTPAIDPTTATRNGLLGLDPPKAATGFGCASADTLRVERRGENEIVFPDCEDFPNPLVRCPAQ